MLAYLSRMKRNWGQQVIMPAIVHVLHSTNDYFVFICLFSKGSDPCNGGVTLAEDSGTIASPEYVNHMDCRWHVEVEDGMVYLLFFYTLRFVSLFIENG